MLKIEKIEKPPNLMTNVYFKPLVKKINTMALSETECNYGYSISKNVNKKIKHEKVVKNYEKSG